MHKSSNKPMFFKKTEVSWVFVIFNTCLSYSESMATLYRD